MSATRQVVVFGPGAKQERDDRLSLEEPLEIRVNGTPIGITMRTPGHDRELAIGFLYGEGLIRSDADIRDVRLGGSEGNELDIATTDPIDLDRLKRHFYATSSCGICGRASIKAIRALSVTGTDADADADTDLIRVSAETLLGLPSQLALAQRMFADSGSLHATGIFTLSGDQACVFEDVGRHNAVDKAIGHCLRHGPWPLDRHVMLVSGRTSFEIVQKAAMARIPVLAAISGPSTLAVDLARDFGITLVGFLRGRQFNVYSRPERITGWS